MINRLAHLFREDLPMPRRKGVPKQQLGTYIPKDVYGALMDFSDASGIPITRIVEDALRKYLTGHYWLIEDDDDGEGE